jgi:hypothetical protein
MGMNKYHNRKVRTSDGIVHDSRKEAIRWQELKLLEESGKILDLKRQMEFLLIPSQYEELPKAKRAKKVKKKLLERAVVYRADFVYHDENGELVIEDVKGLRTRDYIIKRKLMLYVYGIRIKEV